MEQDKDNKAMKPTHQPFPLEPKRGVGGGMVRIKMLPQRAAAGVSVDENGFATVDAATAERLVKIKYAVMAEEKDDGK